jgi:hypothetical protein
MTAVLVLEGDATHRAEDSAPEGDALPLPSLEEQLLALIHGEAFECPACGADVDADDDGRIACAECGSVLEPPPPTIEGQLSLM